MQLEGFELKPCPKCKEDEEISIDSSCELQVSVMLCHSCGYRFQTDYPEDETIRRWNALDREKP